MKTSKKWTIHISCYLLLCVISSLFVQYHPSVKYRNEVVEVHAEALQPTAVIGLDNNNPYAYAGQESDGKLYIYADRRLAIINPRKTENSQLTFMKIDTAANGSMTLLAKGNISIDRQGRFSLNDISRSNPWVISQIKDGEPIMEQYVMRILPNVPLDINPDAVAEAARRVSPGYTPEANSDLQEEKVQEYLHHKGIVAYKSVVFYSLLAIAVVAILIAILFFVERDEIEVTPKSKLIKNGDTLTISTEYQKMDRLLTISNYFLLAVIIAVAACLCTPQLREIVFTNLFDGFFEGSGAIILLTALVCAMAYNCWMMSRYTKEAEDCDTDKGFWLTAVEIVVVIGFNAYLVALWIPISMIPIIIINLILALPNIIIAYSTSMHRSELHWMLPVYETFKWFYGFMLLAFVVILWIFYCLLQGKVRSDMLEEAANAKRQQADGNVCYAMDSDGKWHKFQRVGDGDEWYDASDADDKYYIRQGDSFTRTPY